MRVLAGKNKLLPLVPALLLLALFVLGSSVSLFAEFNELRRGNEGQGSQQPEVTLPPGETDNRGGGASGPRSFDSREADRETLVMDSLRRGVLAFVSWILLIVGLTLVVLTLSKTYVWLKAIQKARVPPTRYFNLQLEVRGRHGDLGLHNFDYYPVVVASSGSADLLLPGLQDPRARFRIDYHQGRALLHSDSSIIVNGVPRQQKLLKQDDRIIFGPYRLMFKDASIKEQPTPVPGRPVFVWQLPIVTMLLALSILFKQGGVVSENKMLLAKAAELQSAGQHAPVVAEQGIADSPVQERGIPEPAIPRSGETAAAVQRPVVREPASPRGKPEVSSTERLTIPEPAPAAPRGRLAVVSAQRPDARVYAAPLQQNEPRLPPAPKPQARQPVSPESVVQTPLEGAIEEAAFTSRDTHGEGTGEQPGETARVAISQISQAAPVERVSPSTAKPVEGSIPSKQEIQRPPDVSEDAVPSDRSVAVSQPRSAGSPFPASEPPVETSARVPAPQAVDASPVREEVSALSQRRLIQQPAVLQASVLGTITPAAMRNDGINPLEDMSFARAGTEPEIGRVKVRVIPPGRVPEYFQADILFIHAHPDDESIDFGSLMARASRSNKRIVTLLFTDGESGLDLYPERKVGDIYPARDLTGRALSQVRVVEATRALSILGSEMYVRWGLKNRPYNTKRDEVPPDEVIRGWGGEEQLVERLVEVLEGFRPTIVISPDRHSKAYEHFEHEAVGQLVQEALQRLRQRGGFFVKGHLVSIDPHQVDRYSGFTEVDAQDLDVESGLAYRSIQALALKEHVTQRDASVIAVSRLSHLPKEFYKIMYWDLEPSLDEYLK